MNDGTADFPPCPVCGTDRWLAVYEGPVRDGAFGAWREAAVRSCAGCGIVRLAERACLGIASYESAEYRHKLAQDHEAAHHFATHDELARFTLDTLWPLSLRGKTVADVGCGGGALLDHLRGLARTVVAIDPSTGFAESLKSRGYAWFPSAAAAAAEAYASRVDVVLSTQVIEHVDDPRDFLADIGRLLNPDGIAIVSTPNRRDVLMELLPETFPPFFYRTQHRWSFDAASLVACAERAGLAVREVRHVHRYGIANTMHWLKDGKPRGRTPLAPLDATIDAHWQAWLEQSGRADNLYVILERADAGAGGSRP
jgi:2-polyprenyl-3-methyl-5-hydroxy-6-metoxy-1,4-benzoquinol methylase